MSLRQTIIAPATIAFCIGSCTVGVAYAHHSLSEFRHGDEITVRGLVEEFRFVNPHASITLDVAADGDTQEWTLLMDDRWELVEDGLSRSTFQAGDELIATGARGRVNRQSMYVRQIERPADGFLYQEDEGEDGPPSFNDLDADGNGSLSGEEIAALYELATRFGQDVGPSADAFFAQLDTDADGEVSEEEYANGL